MQSERLFKTTLRIMAAIIFAAGTSHVVLGLNADQLLGADLSDSALANSGLDSQNRFYGTAFMLYGIVFLLAASDLKRYGLLFQYALVVFFAAGLSRFISVFLYGWPSLLISILFALELIGPPIVLLWYRTLTRE